MKHNNRYLKRACFLLITILTVITSCKKLDEKPIGFNTPENFNATPAQVEATLTGSMNNLWDYWGGYGYAMGNFINDDQYDGGDLVISNNHGSDLWNLHYKSILSLNSA